MGRLTAIVLGSAAGGGFPQWNCRCPVCRLAWAGDARVRPRTQASLAVSADGEDWVLINASPDLPAAASRVRRALHPRAGTRGSPIKAVVLTGAEIDQVTGLLSLREREPFTICATATTLAALADNPMFDALAPDLVTRRAAAARRAARAPGRAGGRAVHGAGQGRRSTSKATTPTPRARPPPNVGVEISAGGARIVYHSGRGRRDRRDARAHRARRRGVLRRHALSRRRDDRERHRQQDRPPHGTHADRRRRRLAGGARRTFAARRIFVHINNTNPILIDGSPERARGRARTGWEIAEDGMEIVL